MKVTDAQVLSQRYVLEAEIGRGGMGIVYRAWDQQLERRVALKYLELGNVSASERPEVQARFEREARMSLQLQHPQIVQVYDYFEENGNSFLVMEYLEGHTLKDYLQGSTKWSGQQLLQFLLQVCDGVHYAHQQGVIHRDLKPDNLFITRNGEAKIMDFGIARQNNAEHFLLTTQPGVMMGTLNYMPPEQLQDTSSVDQRADVFSLGVVMYEIYSGRLPFEGESMGQTILKILSEEPPTVQSHNPQIPDALAKIIAKAMAKRRGQRYQSCADLANDLRALNPQQSAQPLASPKSQERNTGEFWKRQTLRAGSYKAEDHNRTLPTMGSYKDQLEKEGLQLGVGKKLQDRQVGLQLECSPDGLMAWLSLDPTYATDAINDNHLQSLLQKAEISYGIDQEVLQKALTQGYLDRTLVAIGEPPEQGYSCWLEYLLEEPLPRPQEQQDGSVDHRELNRFSSVKAGTPLMRRHPPVMGKAGKNIYGQTMSPDAISDAKLLEGPGTAIASDDPNLLISTRDGMPVKLGQSVRVEDTLELTEVNLTSGNIRFDGTIIIKGGVQKGFEVEAGGDLIIYGTVEGAKLRSGSNIYLHGPVYGDANTLIEARYGVHALFIQQAEIECGGDLMVQDALFHCQARCVGKAVVGLGNGKGLVNGGELYSSYALCLRQAGSLSGTQTRLAVGRHPRMEFQQQELESKQAIIKQKLQNNIKNIIYQRTQGGDSERMQELEKERTELMFESNTLSDEINFLAQSLKQSENPKNCQIEITGQLMSGVLVNLCGSGRAFDEETTGPLKLRLQQNGPRNQEVSLTYGP